MANETPNSPARESFLSRLAKFAKSQDPSRLISAALEQKQFANDQFSNQHGPVLPGKELGHLGA